MKVAFNDPLINKEHRIILTSSSLNSICIDIVLIHIIFCFFLHNLHIIGYYFELEIQKEKEKIV